MQSRDVGKIHQFELKGVPISFQYSSKLNRAGTKLSNASVREKNDNTDRTDNNWCFTEMLCL